jgi:cytochrome c biogenesis protein CcdA
LKARYLFLHHTGLSGIVAQTGGYAWFFVYTAGMGIPALVLLVTMKTGNQKVADTFSTHTY